MSSNTLARREVARGAPALDMRRFISQHLSELVGSLVAVALAIFFTIESPNFFTSDNALVLSQFIAPFAIFALAEVPVLILGEIDLSVGQMYIVSPFFVTYWNNAGVPLLASVALALLVCCGLGLINGLVTVKLRVPSFIATLGMAFALRGIVLIYSNGAPTNPVGSGMLADILGGWPWSEAFWALGIAALLHVMLRGTAFGLHIVAVGGNMESARESGIRVDHIKIWCFVLCAVLGGTIGILDGYHLGSLDPATDGLTFTFYGVTSAVIGGTALTGGRGTMIGALIGACVLGMIKNGFLILGTSSFALDLVTGLTILLAMILNVQIERAATMRGPRGSFSRAVSLVFSIFARQRKGKARL
ncbi:MAG TPA: ABC transporter permease [Chthoniobacterales bacterium]|jgi:simple sugar transport system permease protein|nr:ABC transporter permease [Chthoniobacterales bacterium]